MPDFSRTKTFDVHATVIDGISRFFYACSFSYETCYADDVAWLVEQVETRLRSARVVDEFP